MIPSKVDMATSEVISAQNLGEMCRATVCWFPTSNLLAVWSAAEWHRDAFCHWSVADECRVCGYFHG